MADMSQSLGTTRAILLTTFLVVSTAATVPAQGVYLSGGGGVTFREPGWYPSMAKPSAPGAAGTTFISGAAGIWSDNVGAEGSFTMTGAQSLAWHYNYLFGGNSDMLTDDRDLSLLGRVRIAPLRRRGLSIEPVAGGGITFHRATTFMTADCGSGSMPAPCVAVTPPRLLEAQTSPDWMLTFGVDAAIKVSSHVAVVPGFRVDLAERQYFLTGFDHRGPYSGSGHLWSIGVTARYQVH
jgi:hypothetical protein